MKTILLILSFTFLALLPADHVFAVNGTAAVSVSQLQSPVEGLSTPEILKTPLNQLDDVLGRKLTHREKASVRKIKRLHKKLEGSRGEMGTETTSIVALATGVSGLILLFVPGLGLIGLLACIVGIVFGSISLKKFKRGTNIKDKGRGMGLAGMICGIVGAGIVLLGVLLIASLFAI